MTNTGKRGVGMDREYQRDARGNILYYKIRSVLCNNCKSFSENINIPKGFPVKEYICPICSCIGFLEIKQESEV